MLIIKCSVALTDTNLIKLANLTNSIQQQQYVSALLSKAPVKGFK